MKSFQLTCAFSIALWSAALGLAFILTRDCQDARAPRAPVFVNEERQSALQMEEFRTKSIAIHNLRCVLLNMCGIVLGGVPTAVNVLYNGYFFGLMLRQVSCSSISLSELFFYGEHHFLEIFAFWLSGGIGLLGCPLVFSSKCRREIFNSAASIRLSCASLLIVGVTIFSAWMEAHISLAPYGKMPVHESSADSLRIIHRSSWNAHVMDKDVGLMNDTAVHFIILHHSGFPGMTTPLRIQEYQMKIRGMKDMAYHYYITSDGCVYEGRPIAFAGEHVLSDSINYNASSIGICLAGNFETRDSLIAPAQFCALRLLIMSLMTRYRMHKTDILFHRDCRYGQSDVHRTAGTVCPGRFAIPALTRLLETLEE